MKTTANTPEGALKDTMPHTGARTKPEAVVTAESELNRPRRMAALALCCLAARDAAAQRRRGGDAGPL